MRMCDPGAQSYVYSLCPFETAEPCHAALPAGPGWGHHVLYVMVRRRRQAAGLLCRMQLRNLVLILAGLACSVIVLAWLLQRNSIVRIVSVQQQPAHTAVLLTQQQRQQHRLALGLAMRDSFADDTQQLQDRQLVSRLTSDPSSRHTTDAASPLVLPEDFGFGNFDPKHLTARQESLLNAALTRQTQHSINSMAELEARKRERERARKTARLHMLKDRDILQTFMSSPAYVTWQHERRSNMSGRGIMIAAGGPTQLASAYAMLKTLRQRLKCSLPVELFYQGSSEVDNATMHFFLVSRHCSSLRHD